MTRCVKECGFCALLGISAIVKALPLLSVAAAATTTTTATRAMAQRVNRCVAFDRVFSFCFVIFVFDGHSIWLFMYLAPALCVRSSSSSLE